MELLAIDVAMLLPEPADSRAREINAMLHGFQFESTHLPHVTLLQQFIRRRDLEELSRAIGRIVEGEAPLILQVTGVEQEENTAFFGITRTAELHRLHEKLLQHTARFHVPVAGRSAFYQMDGDKPRLADILLVTRYRTASSRGSSWPHVTLGKGSVAVQVEPFQFSASRLALCQLGRFCTCRAVLAEWILGG